MSITLKVVLYKGLPYSKDLSAQFGPEGGSIGRRVGNTLVLPDPENVVSRQHGKITCVNGEYWYEDTSTAGTYFCNQGLLLEHRQQSLTDGERLRIGDYEVLVSLGTSQAQSPADIFADFSDLSPVDRQGSVLPGNFDMGADPFSEIIPGQSAAKARDDFLSSFREQADVQPFQQSFRPPGIESSAPDIDDLNLDELLSGLGNPEPAGLNLAPAGPAAAIGPITTEPEPFAGPESAAPEDSRPGDGYRALDHDPFADLTGPSGPIPSTPQMAPIPVVDPAGPVPAQVPADKAGLSSGIGPEIPRPKAERMEAASLQEAINRGERANLLANFLKGSGLEASVVPSNASAPQIMEKMGLLFRYMVDGMITVLRARAELKSQFRVSVTTMKAVDNNPLKFSVTAEEAIRLMLNPGGKAFLDPVDAVKEGVSDIISHQIAIQAGIQASLAGKLRQFAPEKFEKAFDEGIVFQKKQKCWEAYCNAYPGLVKDIVEGLFDEEFVAAYERQMMLLASSRK